MPATPLRRKVGKGRVVRTPEGFEVGQSVHFVAVSPWTWIMTLEPVEEAQRLAAALPAPRLTLERSHGTCPRHRTRRGAKAAKSEAGRVGLDDLGCAGTALCHDCCAEVPGDERACRGTMTRLFTMDCPPRCRPRVISS